MMSVPLTDESWNIKASKPEMMTEGPSRHTDDVGRRAKAPARSWTTPRQAFGLFCRGATFSIAAPVALVVGTVLSLINQLQVVVEGDATWATWARVAANYAVPYTVASIGFLSACRSGRRT
jgi:hypothetical protein